METAPVWRASAPELEPSLFANRTFLSIWLGHTISAVGDGFHTVALGLLVLQKTGSALAMSTIFAARILAMILLGPVAGTYCDRVDRRRLMLQMDLLRAVLVGLLAVVAFSPAINVSLVVGLSFVISAAGAFFSPSFNASLINIVGKKDVPRATSLMQLTNTIAQVVGPALGGFIAAAASGGLALGVDSASFLVSTFFIAIVKFPSPARNSGDKAGFWSDLREGMRFLQKQPVILGVMLLGPAFSLFGAAHAIILPVVALRTWHASGFQYGLLEAIWPVGTALAAGTLTLLSGAIKRRGFLVISAFFIAGVLDAIAPLLPNTYTAIPLLLVSGMLAGGGITIMTTLLRTIVPAEMQGRVFGLYGSLANAAWPLGAYAAGLFGDMVPAVLVAVVCGVGFALTGLAGLGNKNLRQFA